MFDYNSFFWFLFQALTFISQPSLYSAFPADHLVVWIEAAERISSFWTPSVILEMRIVFNPFWNLKFEQKFSFWAHFIFLTWHFRKVHFRNNVIIMDFTISIFFHFCGVLATELKNSSCPLRKLMIKNWMYLLLSYFLLFVWFFWFIFEHSFVHFLLFILFVSSSLKFNC